MYEQILPKLISAVQPRAILLDIGKFWAFRSTVPGPGLTAVSEFLIQRHHENGISAEIKSYPADDHSTFLNGHKNSLAWFPVSATLEINEPEVSRKTICSFAEEPLCLISNSAGTPPGGITAEVILVPHANQPDAYDGIDCTGKIILTDLWPLLADELARNHGAVGLITDSVTPPWLYVHPPIRTRSDVPDLTMWGVLNGHHCDTPLWGFSLTPRQGTHLRELIASSKSPIHLRAVIDATLKEGFSEMTNAYLPGTDLAHEEIWILSHSSEPGALDNASGCCASIEIARLLKSLIETESLPPLRRSIRFLSAVETEGYLPYLDERINDLKNIKAALAFDSIGSDFRKTGGILRLNRSPDYNLTFAEDLLESLIAAIAAQPNEQFSEDSYDLFPWQVDPCFPGNDNMIADGFFDIPTPMVDCWPDKFYHSNLDTPDKLSIGTLARCTVIAAAYVYLLASAGSDETRWMAFLTLKAWKHRILSGYNFWDGVDALKSIIRFDSSMESEVSDMVRTLRDFARDEKMLPDQASEPETSILQKITGAASDHSTHLPEGFLCPLQWKPPTVTQLSPKGIDQYKEIHQKYPQIDDVWWLLNRRRTMKEVCMRSSIPDTIIITYLELLLTEEKIIIET